MIRFLNSKNVINKMKKFLKLLQQQKTPYAIPRSFSKLIVLFYTENFTLIIFAKQNVNNLFSRMFLKRIFVDAFTFFFLLQNEVEARLFQTKVPVAIYFDLVYLNIVILIGPAFRNKNNA